MTFGIILLVVGYLLAKFSEQIANRLFFHDVMPRHLIWLSGCIAMMYSAAVFCVVMAS